MVLKWLRLICKQAERVSRAMLKLVSIAQATNAVYQNPLNFGSSIGLQIAGAKV